MISFDQVVLGIKIFFFFLNIFFGWNFTIGNCQILSGHDVSQLFDIFNTQPLWIRGWDQGQESHYIQPSHLSSALINKLFEFTYMNSVFLFN